MRLEVDGACTFKKVSIYIHNMEVENVPSSFDGISGSSANRWFTSMQSLAHGVTLSNCLNESSAMLALGPWQVGLHEGQVRNSSKQPSRRVQTKKRRACIGWGVKTAMSGHDTPQSDEVVPGAVCLTRRVS